MHTRFRTSTSIVSFTVMLGSLSVTACSDDGSADVGEGDASAPSSSDDEQETMDGGRTDGESTSSPAHTADASPGAESDAGTSNESNDTGAADVDAAEGIEMDEADAGETSAFTSDEPADASPEVAPAGKFEIIALPEAALSGFPLAFNDEGQVLIGAAVDDLTYNTLFVLVDGEAEPVDTGDVAVSLNGLNVAACINNSGQIGFNGQREGVHQVVFFDGDEMVDVSFGASDPGLVLRGCNDEGTVVASTATGTEAWFWNDGGVSPIVQEVFAVTVLGITQAGSVAFSSGYYENETFTAYPSSLLASAGPSEDGRVAGMMIDLVNATTSLATWQPGETEATPITELPDEEGVSAVAVSNHGVVLSANVGSNEIRVWLAHDGELTELGAPGYTIERVVDVNAAGDILVAASADDETPIAGLILHP